MKTEQIPMNLLHCNDENGVNSTMNNTKKRVCCLYRVSMNKQVDYNNNHEADIPMQRKACHRFPGEKGERINKRKHELYDLKINKAEAAEKVSILKAEVVKSIQGKSAFSPQMLSELIEEAETEATECEEIRNAAERAVRDSELLLKTSAPDMTR